MHIPAHLTLEIDEHGWYFISDRTTVVYGTGATIRQAMNDYERSFDEYCSIRHVRREVVESLGRSIAENAGTWGELARY